ncbi:MAG: hypothetical protein A2Z25_20020 [Planctomycetes bacterium RBG_16_55_9]|nr:MAG: hypothetical protein A2Z25_20020 [Planctomycetes bacterium RBG_16_55_9]
MRHNVRNNNNRAKNLVAQLAAEKKKVVMALSLIAVMAFMWVRVLARKGPQAAEAVIPAGQATTEERSNPELKISFIELPKVAGRNDVITRDFFACDNWRHFIDGQRKRDGIEQVNILSIDGNEEVIRKVAEKLKLEAIMVSENPQAYVNGKVIEVGDKILIGDGAEKFECDVIAIEENTVVIKCREAQITLKLVQESMTDN